MNFKKSTFRNSR